MKIRKAWGAGLLLILWALFPPAVSAQAPTTIRQQTDMVKIWNNVNICDGNPHTVVVSDIGQTLGYVLYTASGGGSGSLDLKIQGSPDGSSYFLISNTATNPASGGVQANVWMPYMRANLTCSGAGSITAWFGKGVFPGAATGIFSQDFNFFTTGGSTLVDTTYTLTSPTNSSAGTLYYQCTASPPPFNTGCNITPASVSVLIGLDTLHMITVSTFTLAGGGSEQSFEVPTVSGSTIQLSITFTHPADNGLYSLNYAFSKIPTSWSRIMTPIILPPVDGTCAVAFKTANGVTTVECIDTLNSRVGIGSLFAPASTLEVRGDFTLSGSVLLAGTSQVRFGGFTYWHNYGSLGVLSENMFLGRLAGNFTNTGVRNLGLGTATLLSLTTGFQNVAGGANALNALTTGYSDTCVGALSCNAVTTGFENTVLGSEAFKFNIGGQDNVAVGDSAMLLSVTGSENTAVGHAALINSLGISQDSAIGCATMYDTTTGSENVGLGCWTGSVDPGDATQPRTNVNTTGSKNTWVGNSSGPGSHTQLDNTITLGWHSRATQSNQTMLGNWDTTQTVIPGDLAVANPGTLAAESLTNGVLTGGASWTQTGDMALSGNAAVYTDSTHVGTLSQASGTLAIAGVANAFYRFTYSVSSPTGTPPVCDITTTFALVATSINTSYASGQATTFQAAASPGNFTISCTSVAGGGFTLDTLSLKQITGGNLNIGGTFTAAGYAGTLSVSKAGAGYTNVAEFYDTTAGSDPFIAVGKAAGAGANAATLFGYDVTGNFGFIGISGFDVKATQGLLIASTGGITVPTYSTTTNCADSAGAAACGSAAAGAFVIDAGSTSTVVSTTAITANSQVFLQEDSSLGARLSVTCNTQSALVLGPPVVTARTAGTSFTATIVTGPTTNPMCVSYFIEN